MEKKIVLSIAGSDPSGGAGMQVDLNSFSTLGVHGTSVVTCVTAQNTTNVKQIFSIPVDIIEGQIDTLYEDIHPDAVKTGMLYTERIASCVGKKMAQYAMKPVVDPVLVATSGDSLALQNLVDALKKNVLPKTYMLTANIPEAGALLDRSVVTVEEMKKACKELHTMGPSYVLIKGGHLRTGEASDVLFDGNTIRVFSLPRILDKKVHGSGCSLSALITGFLASGESVEKAVQQAKSIVWGMIQRGLSLGKGAEILDHSIYSRSVMPPAFPSRDHFLVWSELLSAVDTLVSCVPSEFVPEVGMNMGFAVPHAQGVIGICALEGRIVKIDQKLVRLGGVRFGVSKHIASIILAVMSFDPSVRCAVNLAYAKATVDALRKAGLKVGSFDRRKEPVDASSTMEWGTKQVIMQLGGVPDVIYDTGDIGKEPMIRVLGTDPKDVIAKVQQICK